MVANKVYFRNRISRYNSGQVLTVVDNNGEIYEGNYTFYEIWSMLDGHNSVHEIISYFKNKYNNFDSEEIECDIMCIFEEMIKYGLISEDRTISPQIIHTSNQILSVHIAITSNCNLQCKHCYLDNKSKSSISLDEYLTILKELSSIGVLTLEISGGEPLTHRNFLEFIRLAKLYGFYIKLFTNATLIDANVINDIKEYVDSFRVSLDGAIATHNLRRGKGTYEKTFSALQLLKNCNVQVSMTVDDINCHDIREVKIITEQLGHKFEASPVVPYSHIEFSYDKLKAIHKIINQEFVGENQKRANFRGANCEAGCSLLYISSELNVTPCPLLHQKKWQMGNLKNKSIIEILNSANYREIMSLLGDLKSKCIKCNKCQFWCAAIIEQTPDRISPFCIKCL